MDALIMLGRLALIGMVGVAAAGAVLADVLFGLRRDEMLWPRRQTEEERAARNWERYLSQEDNWRS